MTAFMADAAWSGDMARKGAEVASSQGSRAPGLQGSAAVCHVLHPVAAPPVPSREVCTHLMSTTLSTVAGARAISDDEPSASHSPNNSPSATPPHPHAIESEHTLCNAPGAPLTLRTGETVATSGLSPP